MSQEVEMAVQEKSWEYTRKKKITPLPQPDTTNNHISSVTSQRKIYRDCVS